MTVQVQLHKLKALVFDMLPVQAASSAAGSLVAALKETQPIQVP